LVTGSSKICTDGASPGGLRLRADKLLTFYPNYIKSVNADEQATALIHSRLGAISAAKLSGPFCMIASTYSGECMHGRAAQHRIAKRRRWRVGMREDSVGDQRGSCIQDPIARHEQVQRADYSGAAVVPGIVVHAPPGAFRCKRLLDGSPTARHR